MRLIKMFGLAAIVVGAFMAFIGATSASAVTSLEEVVLCKEDAVNAKDECPEGKDFPIGTVVDGTQIGTGTLLGEGFGDITCTAASTSGESSELLAHGLITSTKFSGCKHLGSACTVEAVELSKEKPWLWLVLLNAKHDGYHLVISKHTKGVEPKVHAFGCFGVNCTFSSTETLFELLLEATDVVADVLQEVKNSGGGFCPATSVWHAKFLIKCLEGVKEVGCWPKMELGSILKTP